MISHASGWNIVCAHVKQDCLETANLNNPKHDIPDQLANRDGRQHQDAGAFHAIDPHGGGVSNEQPRHYKK